MKRKRYRVSDIAKMTGMSTNILKDYFKKRGSRPVPLPNFGEIEGGVRYLSKNEALFLFMVRDLKCLGIVPSEYEYYYKALLKHIRGGRTEITIYQNALSLIIDKDNLLCFFAQAEREYL